jgi:D-glycero-alpha-D-manno-heptose-7-phosphate kinase
VEPVTLDPTFAAALERQIVLCYTGRSRLSGATIARVMTAYERGDARVASALHGIKDTAEQMAAALRACDLARVGMLLAQNWRHQRDLDPAMQTAEMARLEQAVMRAGVLGGKAAGSGAGGCMFFLVSEPRAAVAAAEAAREAGATVLPVAWAEDGVRAW